MIRVNALPQIDVGGLFLLIFATYMSICYN